MPTRTDPDRPGWLVQPLEPCAVLQFVDREEVRIVLNDRQVRTVHQRLVALVGDPVPSLELALGLACDALDDEGYAPRRFRLVTDYNAEFERLMAKRYLDAEASDVPRERVAM